jgi:serine/threonine-protein kinase
MDCPSCQQPNIDGARFCAKCGALMPVSAPADEHDPLIGNIVGGRFRITGVLGEGGMGRVYTGEQQMGTSVRKVAVKTLLAQYARDPQVLARFMRECGTVSELEHPNTIKVHDFGQTDSGELYIAMELLSGVSLEKELERGALRPERVDFILGQMCGSLQEAHDKGIVHRDLKPANVYLTIRAGEEDYVKVLDFGIAKREDKNTKVEEKLTVQGTVLGTPPYMSPEQFKGGELDARSDIYSLGVMTYEMLTGRLPFDADTPWVWATQHMTAQPFPFETIPLGSQVPPKMKAAVMRALSKDTAHRQQTVREFYEEFTMGAPKVSAMSSGPRSSLPEGATPSGTALMPVHPTGAGMPSSPGMNFGNMPTGAGPAFPSPPEKPPKSNLGPILGIVAVVAVVGIVGTVIFLKSRETGTGTVKTAKTATHPPASGAPADTKGEQECRWALNQANQGNVVAAVNHYKGCEGQTRGAAGAAIDRAAQRSAARPGCAGLEDAKAADRAGQPTALGQMHHKNCR